MKINGSINEREIIDGVAASMQISSISSQDILKVMAKTAMETNMIAETWKKQEKMAESLRNIVCKFKI